MQAAEKIFKEFLEGRLKPSRNRNFELYDTNEGRFAIHLWRTLSSIKKEMSRYRCELTGGPIDRGGFHLVLHNLDLKYKRRVLLPPWAKKYLKFFVSGRGN